MARQYFKVSFQYSEYVYCANIAIAESIDDVNREYSQYTWYSVKPATECDVQEAREKHMPVIEIEHAEQAEQNTTTEQEENDTMTTAEKLMQYFDEHEDDFVQSIEELDSYNGYLGDDRYYSMDELDELHSGCSATELLNRAFFGHDAENWHYDASGNKEYGAFNPNREYFYYNGYGNLVSADYKDYSDRLDSWFIENLIENADNLCLPDGVAEILAEAEDPEND